MQVHATPYDEEMAAVSLASSAAPPCPTAATRRTRSVREKLASSSAAPASSTADRLSYSTRHKKVVFGDDELLAALDEGKLRLEDINPRLLPAELRESFAPDDLRRALERRRAERDRLLARADALRRQRDEYLDAQHRKAAAATPPPVPGSAIAVRPRRLPRQASTARCSSAIREQARRKGIDL